MPDEGMYSQRDPIGIAGGNPSLYGYVWDSTKQVDVFGLDVDTKILTWNEFQSANAGIYDQAGMSRAWDAYKAGNGINSNSIITGAHGNSLSNPNTNYGYALVDRDTPRNI